MQGNKKHTEGHSDSSSIGSLLDDADREVSSLTDRAFKSLCLAELEDPYNEPELSISPDFALQLSAKIHSGTLNHDIRKSNVCDKLTARNNEHTIWASTFQQLPKCASEEKRIAKNTFAMEKKLNLPVPGPKNNKHVSKVSSLIKTFDKTADQGSGSSLIANKQPIRNSFQKYKINHGNDIASWDNTDILSIHKELSEFPEASQSSHYLSGKHEPQRRPNKIDMSYGDSDGYYPVLIEMSKVAKSNFSHSSKKALKNRNLKISEPAKKGSFLHSENSAFESWNVHHKKMTEKEEFVDMKMKKESLAYLEESPFVKGSHTHEHKLSAVMTTAAKKTEKDFQPTLQEASFCLRVVPQGPLPSETKFPAAFPPTPPPRNHVPQGPPRPPPAPPALPLPPPSLPSHPSAPPSPEAPPVPPPPVPARLSPTALSQASVSPQSVSCRMVSPSLRFETPSPPPAKPQASSAEQESLSPQLGSACPPWRRQRATERAAGKRQAAKEKVTDSHKSSLAEKKTGADPALHVAPLAKQTSSPGSSSPSFNITELLTPVIPPKQEVGTAERELIPLTPPPTESTASGDHEESTLDDYRSWDNYRLTASSLLFNLKDVRKRVKSIYTPSPLLRALEEKNKTRENIHESTKTNTSFSTLHDKNEKNITEKDELSDIAYVLPSSAHEKDSKNDLTGHFTGNYPAFSSPQTTEDLPFYQTGDSMEQDNSKHQDLVKNTGDNENFPSFRHESNEPDLGKHQQYPAQRPFSRDNVDTKAGQNHSVQGEENEGQAAIQNENFTFKTLLNQLSPEENEPYSGTQTNIVVPGHEARGKRSTSSSEQSFVSTVEQPLQEEPFLPVPLMEQMSLQESQRTVSEMGSGSKKRHEERGKEVGEDELQYYACISPGTDAAEKREGSVTGNEQRNLKEKLGREKKEEANSTNSASDSMRDMSIPRSEEPQTPSSSSSTKPSLFMIKDNTFRSPQVIKAVKLPLLRSFSLDDTVSSSYREMERKFMSPAAHSKRHRNVLHAQEGGWGASRHRGQQDVRDGAADREKEASEAGSTSVTMDPNLLEDTESFSFGKLTEEDEKTCMLLNKFGKMNEESVCRSKKKPTKARHSLAQPIIGLEDDQAQNNPSYPSERKTNYFKNHHLSNRKGGSCTKKIISRETISPVTGSILEDHTCSSVSNDTLEDILHTGGAPVLLDNLSCSAVASPRSGSTMHSLAASSLSDKPSISGLGETEDVTNPALLNMALERHAYVPAEEIIDSAQRNLLSDVAGENGRLEPRGLGGRPAGKPPTVPPKTEKALRRAKKLANKRKKVQEQQKNHQTEHTDAVGRKPTHSGETTVSAPPLGYSPLHPPLPPASTPTETTTGKSRLAPAANSSPSSTQRKLLQDPDSGQYYVVDLPAEVNLKTFYDPETGKYVQVSVPSLEQNLHQPTSSEIKNSPYASYPRVLPLPASSVAVLKSPSQLSEPAWSVSAGPEPAELPEGGQQHYRYTESVDTEPYTEPASYSYHQDDGETQVHLGKDVSPIQNTGIVTLTNLDDFAAEGVS
ncbi:cardiac-enriched FHL2-interacting protein [Catharus ustulatus]|uniref:cardiac-enriched FHL2-interacting protein n=1 Tax=Catharus ustulatus TaxID=91951 RepID=UPI00140A1578|nr:cardiac-enriched FHL2-interacting protein [Catharus ustulatus]XP_032922564.1 cardiac-enriched FHL2-interacting protein [Catharus ustulatus]